MPLLISKHWGLGQRPQDQDRIGYPLAFGCAHAILSRRHPEGSVVPTPRLQTDPSSLASCLSFYPSATAPSSLRQTGFLQSCPFEAAKRTASSLISIPSPGPSGIATYPS